MDTPVSKRARHESEPATLTQRALFKSPLKLLKGARSSNNPIYAFFKVDDVMKTHPISGIETVDKKEVVCHVMVGGAICGVRLKQTRSTTSSLLSHLEKKHKPAYARYLAEKARIEAAATGSLKKIDHLYKTAGGFPEADDDDDFVTAPKNPRLPGTSGKKKVPSMFNPTPLPPYHTQSDQQLKFDLWLTEYFVRLSLPWAIMDTDAHKQFWKKINYRYQLKHSRTFAKRKLPELYRITKTAVDAKITKELKTTDGVAFTCDHWTSRNMDPYFGFTMHLISKDWQLLR